MHFLSKILRGITDESVHRAFLRYGKGEYDGPTAEITISRAGKVKVRSTYLYQDLVASVFAKLTQVESLFISGIVLGYEKLDKALMALGFEASPFTKKPRTKLFQSKIAGEYAKSQIIPLYDDIGEKAYIFCNLTTSQEWTHKSKSKIPSAQKQVPISEQLKYSSTKIPAGTTFVETLLKELTPDFSDVIPDNISKLQIENTYIIQDFVFPPDKNQLSSKEIRLKTKRKGLLRRKLIIDDDEFLRERSLLV